VKRLITERHQRSNTIQYFQGIVASTSRALTDNSIATLENWLDRLWQHAERAQAHLDVAQQRLLATQERSREGVLTRIATPASPALRLC